MPIYEYACGCGTRFEALQRSGAAPPPCPACSGAAHRRPPSRVSLGGRAKPPPGPEQAPRTWEETHGGDRETILHWRRTLEERSRLEEKYPELAGDRRPVLAHEGPYAREPLRAPHPHPHPHPHGDDATLGPARHAPGTPGMREDPLMRVLIAPDKFAGTLSAVAAAEAIAAGWRDAAPEDELDLAPLSDGGPGFVDVLHAAAGGTLLAATVTDPLGAQVSATVLRRDGTAYIEAAQACGLHLVPEARRDATATTSYGVGELIAAAVDDGARHLVVGLGGSATNDGGAGMLAALGARPDDALRRGGLALRELSSVDLGPARSRVAGAEIVAATDVDNPLLGSHGASAVFGPQKGATPAQVAALDRALARWAELTAPARADQPGAGAAGGLGHALFLLGAHRASGIEAVLDAVRVDERVAAADLVVTGEGSFDLQSLRGKVVSGVARAATRRGVPCLVLAGRVEVGQPELAAAGIDAAYAVADSAGSTRAAMARPARELSLLAARTARGWARWESNTHGGYGNMRSADAAAPGMRGGRRLVEEGENRPPHGS